MPYLILVIGVLIGVYALYRFFLTANTSQIKALGFSIFVAIIVIALIILALTGKLPAALGLLVALLPFIVAYMRGRKETEKEQAAASSNMSEKEAFEVLGLQQGASLEEIDAAFKKLMLKLHPDSEGSDWMAAKLNQARAILLKK